MLHTGRARSLRTAVVLLAAASAFILVSLCLFVFYFSMPSMLRNSEDQYMEKQMDVITGQFKADRDNLTRITADVAIWDNTVHYIQGRYPSYWENAWPDGSPLKAYEFNFAIMRNRAGYIVHQRYYNYRTNSSMPKPEDLSVLLKPIADDVLAQFEDTALSSGELLQHYGVEGILPVGDDVWLFCTMPVMQAHTEGRPSGTLTFGILLDEAYFHDLTSFTGMDVWWEDAGADDTGHGRQVEYVGDEEVTVEIPFRTIENKQIQLKMSEQRPIYASGQSSIAQASVWVVLVCLCFNVALVTVIHRMFARPVRRLSTEIAAIRPDQTLDTTPYQRSREFSSLAASINSMLTRLNESNISFSTLQSILDQLDAYLYVTDIETYDILFANAKMRPTGISDLSAKSVKKKFKDKAFAAKIDREVIQNGADMLGMELSELITLCIEGMRPYAAQLGIAGS